MPRSANDIESIVPQFVSAALQHPAIPLAEVSRRIDSPRACAARGRVNYLLRSRPEARSMARGAEGLARALAADIVANRSGRGGTAEDRPSQEDMLDAVLPLAYAVIARDLGESYGALRPLLDLAKRVAPRIRF